MVELKVYVDGSYMKEQCKGGYVVLKGDDPILARKVLVKIQKYTSGRNVTGELFAAFTAIADISATVGENMPIKVVIYHDYKGIADFVTGAQVPSKDMPIYYTKMVNSILAVYKKLDLHFVKVKGHSNNKWNDIADTIAKGYTPSGFESIMADTAVYE